MEVATENILALRIIGRLIDTMEDNMDNGISGIVASLEVQGLIDIHFVLVVDKADIVLVYFMDVGN